MPLGQGDLPGRPFPTQDDHATVGPHFAVRGAGGGAGVDEQAPASADIDMSRASIARVYDYLLGGKEHLEVDRRAADAMINVVPEVGETAKHNRCFLRRGVQYLVREAGIRQIVDVGSGLPSDG